jgi:hypothetical protein
MSGSSESNIFERRGVVEGLGEPLAVLRMVWGCAGMAKTVANPCALQIS